MEGSSLICTKNLSSVEIQKYDTARKLILKLMNYKAYLLQDGVPGELHLKRGAAVQVVHSERSNLHDIANVKQVEPFTLI